MALGGLDPIIIFQLYKLTPAANATLAKIPLTSEPKTKVTFAIIPIYLSEKITGIFIDSESKSVDINTDIESTTDGTPPPINQKALASITTVNLVANQNSVGLQIFLALSELLLDKVTSQEYELTYMHGSTTVFGGKIHGFSYDQGTDNDLCKIKLEISRGTTKTKSVVVDTDPTAVRLGSTGSVPPAGASTASGSSSAGSSVIQPGLR